jgi:hypothetical protein
MAQVEGSGIDVTTVKPGGSVMSMVNVPTNWRRPPSPKLSPSTLTDASQPYRLRSLDRCRDITAGDTKLTFSESLMPTEACRNLVGKVRGLGTRGRSATKGH